MKLDAKAIRYLTSEDFRVLAGVLISPSTPPCAAFASTCPIANGDLLDRWKLEVGTMKLFQRP